MADDLSEFRKNWLKELHLQERKTPDSDFHFGTDERQKVTPNNQEEELFSSTDVEGSKSPYEPGTSSSLCDHSELHKTNQEHNQDGQSHSFPAVNSVQEENILDNLTETSATYYPFRILTTLLNHASSEEGKPPTLQRPIKKEKETLPKKDILKRAYFSSSGECDNFQEEKSVAKKSRLKENNSAYDNKKSKQNGFLDLFIADLDEISEIPFFDISLPREVAVKIFWHLDVVDLCRCAQVSSSWRSLAEDELLWCHICHKLGYDTDKMTTEQQNWKSRAQHYTVLKTTLLYNWKNRTGKLHNLHHAKGGVLCAAVSHKSTIVAGYSNCESKLWDVLSGETCVFRPSSTALVIDESSEEGTICNQVQHIVTGRRHTAASYTHGFVDVWSNEEGTEPVYTVTCAQQAVPSCPSSLALLDTAQDTLLALSVGHSVKIHQAGHSDCRLRDTLWLPSVVKKTAWFQPKDDAPCYNAAAMLAVSTNYTVQAVSVDPQQSASPCPLNEMHNIVDAPVTCFDTATSPALLATAFTLNTGPAQYFKVNVTDVVTRQVLSSLAGHTSSVLCLNLALSPPHRLVTGSHDRKVRVFDRRVSQCAAMTLMGHVGAVTSVQMDDCKVVSGDEAGFVRVWDQRMASKLWEMNNRHPVGYCHFDDRKLVVAHIPYVKQHYDQDFDTGLHQRHRGSLHVYDFLANQTREGVPEICLSSYDQADGYNYNINLAMPYD